MAVSPDGRYVVTVNAGLNAGGTFESQYEQSLAVLDTQTGALADFPDDRTLAQRQADALLRPGLQPRREATSLRQHGLLTDPLGDGKEATGSGIVVYSFTAGKIAPERFIPSAAAAARPGRKTKLIGAWTATRACPSRRRLRCWLGGRGKAAGRRQPLRRCAAARCRHRANRKALRSLGERCRALHLSHRAGGSKDGKRAPLSPCGTPRRLWSSIWPRERWAASWPCSSRQPGQARHPSLRLRVLARWQDPLRRAGQPRCRRRRQRGRRPVSVKGYFDTRLPPELLWRRAGGAGRQRRRQPPLCGQCHGSDAVAVIDTRKLTAKAAKQGMVEPLGFVPTEWMPISMAFLALASGGSSTWPPQRAREPAPTTFPSA
jgi:hypothetical protein